MKISTIVCHHRGTLVDNAVRTLLTSKEVDQEIIVATSLPESVDRLKGLFPDIKVVEIAGGPAKKRNVATRFATGDVFAFFDDDVEVNDYTVYFLVRALEDSKVGMAYGKILNMEFRDRLDEAGSFLTWSGFLYARCQSGLTDIGQFEDRCRILSGKSASCIVRRKTFWLVGGFDESYEILGEETDLAWRIWLRGHEVHYIPDSFCFHAFNTRFKPIDFYIPRRVYFNGCRNYIAMLITNLEVKNLIIPLITQAFVWITAGFVMMFTGKFEAGKNIFKGLAWTVIHLKEILHKRRVVQRSRVINDGKLLKIITQNPPFSYYVRRFLRYITTGLHG